MKLLLPHIRSANQAAESLSLEQAGARLLKSERWTRTIMRRLEPRLPDNQPLKVLDVGCAQGRTLIALARMGYLAYGIEPSIVARNVAIQLAEQEGVRIEVTDGVAENIPFDSGFFDVVLATSVMEHVLDLNRSLQEIHRVLRPGGVFWFNSASAMCPRQREISSFPFFGWYPDRFKRAIMTWAKVNRPDLIGYTEYPAINWWTPRKAWALLRKAGFAEVRNRWEIRHPSESSSRIGTWILSLARKQRLLQFLGDVIVPDCSYLAIKENKVS